MTTLAIHLNDSLAAHLTRVAADQQITLEELARRSLTSYTAAYNEETRAALEDFQTVLDLLVRQQKLSPKYCDHPLAGNYHGYRECHIQPDWLLIYKVEEQKLLLTLVRTGTHSDLF